MILKVNGQVITTPVQEVAVAVPAKTLDRPFFNRYKENVKTRAEKYRTAKFLVPVAMAVGADFIRPESAFAAASLGDNTAFKGDGHYLLDIVVISVFSMVIVTICKLAGRGEIAGVVLFLSGCVVLLDVVKVFTHLYGAIATFVT